MSIEYKPGAQFLQVGIYVEDMGKVGALNDITVVLDNYYDLEVVMGELIIIKGLKKHD